jgi:hypothetical protein
MAIIGTLMRMTLAPVGMLERGKVTLARQTAPEGAFAWSVWPAKERPARAWLVMAALAAICVCTSAAMGDLWIGVMAALAIAVSLQRFLLPTDCMLTADGITIHEPLRVHRIAWTAVEGVIWKQDQGLLRATRDAAGRVIARHGGVRGVVVPLGSDPVAAETRRRAIEAFLDRHGR